MIGVYISAGALFVTIIAGTYKLGTVMGRIESGVKGIYPRLDRLERAVFFRHNYQMLQDDDGLESVD